MEAAGSIYTGGNSPEPGASVPSSFCEKKLDPYKALRTRPKTTEARKERENLEKPKGFQEFLTRVWREAWMRLGWNVLELQGHPARLGEEARQGRGKLCRVQLQVNVTSCLNQRWALSQHMMTFAGPWSALLITREGPSEAKVMNTMFSD